MATTIKNGTHDLQWVIDHAPDGSVLDFGYEELNNIVQADLNAHNTLVDEMVGTLAGRTNKARDTWGGNVDNAETMQEVDEYGFVSTERDEIGPQTVGFPMKLYQKAIGWTRRFMETKSASDLARAVLFQQKKHINTVKRELRKSLYTPTNRTVRDLQIDKTDLYVKALINADSSKIPAGYDPGIAFNGASHTHYLARAAGLALSDLVGLESHVIEHGHNQGLRYVIHYNDEAAFKSAAGSSFTKFEDPRIEQFESTVRIPTQRANLLNPYNRDIGIMGSAIVSVRPWATQNYVLYGAFADPEPILMYRDRGNGLSGLRIAAEHEEFPLHAQYFEAEFGFGVKNRTAAAILYIGGTTWVTPTF